MFANEYPILTDQLCPGLFIRLDLKDNSSPFFKKSFKIKDEAQIEKIKAMGLSHVICIQDKSDRLPISLEELAAAKPAPSEYSGRAKTPVSSALARLRSQTITRNKARRESFGECENRYSKAVGHVVNLLKQAQARPEEAMAAALKVVGPLVETFLSDMDVLLSMMTTKPKEESKNYHALNVTVLSMMLARELSLSREQMLALGLGALFHDIGLGRLPMSSIRDDKAVSMSAAVRNYYREHPRLGVKIVAGFPDFPALAQSVILQHHETMDGKGFPDGLPGDKISTLARIVGVANVFDRLCNRVEPQGDLTPHQALKQMYRDKGKLDEVLLAAFIRNLGVYPPGSLVELSNKVIGLVLSVNPKNSVRPEVLLYLPEVPKKEAIIADLMIESDWKIVKSLGPQELSREAFAYLSPRRQVNFFAESLPGS